MENSQKTMSAYQLWAKNATIEELIESGKRIGTRIAAAYDRLVSRLDAIKEQTKKHRSCLTPVGFKTGEAPTSYNAKVAQGPRNALFTAHYLMWLSYIQSSACCTRITNMVDSEIAIQEALLGEAQRILYGETA